jgi:coatomer subunit beta'
MLCGADDMLVRVYNYNTMDKVKQFEAHTDYIRHIAVHPTLPVILTCSDDMLIKLWDWDRNWACTQVFEGHSHYVMQVVFNPKDTNTFASASLDRTVKVWSLGSPVPNFTLEGHERGVNAIDYYTGGDRPYLVSGADDRLVKVWDYQTKACIQTLDGHSHNVAAVAFHPELPLIVTGSEDGAVKLWHATTYRLETTLSYGMERVWSLATVRGSNSIAVGYDEGCVMVKLGREDPVASMDAGGKVIWARHNEIQTVNIKALGEAAVEEADGERLPLAVKDLGSSDIYPQSLAHSPNGRFVAVCGDGEYVVYTALAWRNKAFGPAQEFVWADDSNVFATREAGNVVKIHKNFKEALTIRLGFAAEAIHGGRLLGVRTSEFIVFYDWGTGAIVRRVDVAARNVHWSESGATVVIAGETSFYMLGYEGDAVEAFFAAGGEPDDDGIEDAFDLQAEIPEAVRTGIWVGDCFIYNNAAWRLNYCVGGEVTTLHHLDRPMYLLGYLAAQGRVYLIDREFGIVSYTLLLSVVEYKTLVMRGEMETAAEVLDGIPKDQWNTLAKFLEAKDMPELALEVATDPDFQFELAVALGRLELAQELAAEADSEVKWRQLGELALNTGNLGVAEACFEKAKDLGGLLLLYTSRGDAKGCAALAAAAETAGRQNIAFLCKFLLADVDGCIDLLAGCGRLPEAAFFARTYKPSRMAAVVSAWQTDLAKINPKAAESLANPEQYENLFPSFQDALVAERALGVERAAPLPASAFTSMEGANLRDVIEAVQNMSLGEGLSPAVPVAAAVEVAAPPAPEPTEGLLPSQQRPMNGDPRAWFGAQDAAEAAAAAAEAPEPPAAASPAYAPNPAYETEPAAAVEEDEEEDVFADAAPEPEPAAPPPAPAAPTFTASGLTAEEEAMLEADLAADDLEGLDDVDVDDEDLDLDDDWGLGDEEEKKD